MPKNMSKALATSVMEEKTKGGKEGGREREREVLKRYWVVVNGIIYSHTDISTVCLRLIVIFLVFAKTSDIVNRRVTTNINSFRRRCDKPLGSKIVHNMKRQWCPSTTGVGERIKIKDPRCMAYIQKANARPLLRRSLRLAQRLWVHACKLKSLFLQLTNGLFFSTTRFCGFF